MLLAAIVLFDCPPQIWKYSFKKVSSEPEDHPVILTEVPFNPKANREKMTQIMFETFNTPAVYVANQAALALLGCGRTTGVVYDSGDSVSHSVPIYEGHALNHATFRVNLAGHDLTESLGQMLSKQGLQFNNQSSFNDTVREIKEKLCYVAQNYEAETQAMNEKREKLFRLPDGQEFTLDQECIQCPEALFMPTLIQSDTASQLGIHDSCYKSITSCDVDLREELYGNIVLSGGNTMFSGIADRMQKRMTDIAPPDSNINVIAPPERNYLTWTGGSVLGSLSTFKQMWISRQEYEETGVYIVHSKCF